MNTTLIIVISIVIYFGINTIIAFKKIPKGLDGRNFMLGFCIAVGLPLAIVAYTCDGVISLIKGVRRIFK